MNDVRPYTRQSTLLELSRTRTGRLVMALVALQAKKEARTKEEGRIYAGAAGYMTLEKMARVSNGKLPWGVVDSIIDLANGDGRRVAARIRRSILGGA
jgi:hypothetical protein